MIAAATLQRFIEGFETGARVDEKGVDGRDEDDTSGRSESLL
jgi:hypothetical protein